MNRTAAAIALVCFSASLVANAAEGKPAVVAVLVAPGEHHRRAADIAAALEALIAEEPGFVPVERGRLDALLGEQKLAFTGLADASTCARTGRLLQADFMISMAVSKEGVGFRIVETATAKVLAESGAARPRDVFLAARMIFERLVGSVKRAPKLSDRLTVGIGAIFNESGTDRSDRLCEELAERIRHHLRRESWAIVLERQYPEPLLAELGLARSGLAERKVVAVPQADVVIAGSFVEQMRRFARGMDYPVSFKITVAGGRGRPRYEFEVRGTSREIDGVARDVVKRARLHRRRLRAATAVGAAGENEVARLWRAAKLFAPYDYTHKLSDGTTARRVNVTTDRDRADLSRTIRLLENVLLVGGGRDDAKMLLGRSLIALYEDEVTSRRQGDEEEHARIRRQFSRGIDLVYEVAQRDLSERNAVACDWVARRTAFAARQYAAANRWVKGKTTLVSLRSHADRLTEFMLANQGKFTAMQIAGIRPTYTGLHPDRLFEEFRRIASDPGGVNAGMASACIRKIERAFRKSPKRLVKFALEEVHTEDPCATFFLEHLAATQLHKLNDPAAVEHFLEALELAEYGTCALDKLYHEAHRACTDLGRPEKAREVVEHGANRLLEAGPMDARTVGYALFVADSYAEDGRFREAFDLCERAVKVVFAGGEYIELRERLKARLGGRRLPDFRRLERISGEDYERDVARLRSAILSARERLVKNAGAPGSATPGIVVEHKDARFATGHGRVWVIPQGHSRFGTLYLLDPAVGKLRHPERRVYSATCVAAAGGRAFCGTRGDGLHVFDSQGHMERTLLRANGEIPSDYIEALVATGAGKKDVLYLAFSHSWRESSQNRFGVAHLDPRTLKVKVLSPSSRHVGFEKEPVRFLRELWWCPEQGILWVGCRRWQWFYYRQVLHQDVFRYKNGAWSHAGEELWPSWKAVCDGRTLHVFAERHGEHRGLRTVTMQLRRGQTLLRSDDPLVLTASDAAWDERRLWLATYAGLYEVDRATGRMRCIAHKDKTPVFALLKDGGWLYIGARDGIYRYRIP